MVTALHQDLNTAQGRKFVEFCINLLEGEHVMIVVFFGPIKRAKLAINVADIGVVNVAINDVSDNLASLSVIGARFRQITPCIGEDPKILQGPAVKLESVLGRDPFPGENFLDERVPIE
jgi:hypothetical protein